MGQPTRKGARPQPGFDFTGHMRRLCTDIAARLPEYGHINVERVAMRVCQTRKRTTHGIYASLTPLRFEGGRETAVRRGRTWRVQTVRDTAGREMLYLLSFYLPRFCDQPYLEKLATVMHELWHIGPQFDGDLRRHPGRCYAHGPSEAEYHGQMRVWAERWLSLAPAPELHHFLEQDFQQLRAAYGAVVGTRLRTPRLFPVSSTAAG